MFKVANGKPPEIMNHLRHTLQFHADQIHSVFNGSESASHLRPKLFNKYLPKLILISILINININSLQKYQKYQF